MISCLKIRVCLQKSKYRLLCPLSCQRMLDHPLKLMEPFIIPISDLIISICFRRLTCQPISPFSNLWIRDCFVILKVPIMNHHNDPYNSSPLGPIFKSINTIHKSKKITNKLNLYMGLIPKYCHLILKTQSSNNQFLKIQS